jgi:hypothetical protein
LYNVQDYNDPSVLIEKGAAVASQDVRDTAEMLSVFSHDFKNRVNSITLALWLLERKTPGTHDAVEEIKEQMQDLAEMVEQVRAYKKGA